MKADLRYPSLSRILAYAKDLTAAQLAPTSWPDAGLEYVACLLERTND